MVDLFPEDESIGFEYAELSRRDSEQEEQEVQEEEEEEDEATLVEVTCFVSELITCFKRIRTLFMYSLCSLMITIIKSFLQLNNFRRFIRLNTLVLPI